MSKPTIMIQARLGSNRLPKKTIAKIQDKPVIWHVINRVKKIKNVKQIVLITTTGDSDKILLDIVKQLTNFFIIVIYCTIMDDEKGKEFLKLIDDQNTVQWNIVAKLSSLIKADWNSTELKTELETLVKDHYKITSDLNSLDDDNSIL